MERGKVSSWTSAVQGGMGSCALLPSLLELLVYHFHSIGLPLVGGEKVGGCYCRGGLKPFPSAGGEDLQSTGRSWPSCVGAEHETGTGDASLAPGLHSTVLSVSRPSLPAPPACLQKAAQEVLQ